MRFQKMHHDADSPLQQVIVQQYCNADKASMTTATTLQIARLVSGLALLFQKQYLASLNIYP